MKPSSFRRRLAGVVLAGALSLAGLFAAAAVDSPTHSDQTDEVAGGTWSRVVRGGGEGGGFTTNGGTWS